MKVLGFMKRNKHKQIISRRYIILEKEVVGMQGGWGRGRIIVGVVGVGKVRGNSLQSS